ncbi:MAG: excinuclease ABC subunit UvrC [Desulfobulbaceae bacterium]|jgi:excinuclease ABC subunit C|nr:excinuclease ABC subunit UvrC [Desulfobulbaceae bacterium]
MFPPEQLANTPHAPGVYLMLDKKSTVIYVGKAKDLRKRLASYAHDKGAGHSKTTVMLSRVDKVDILITHTEKEALILEASLIKRHRPRYNIILRDDKNYPLIKLTMREEWPRVFMARRRKKDGARYFGPYADVGAMWATLKLIHRLFPLRRCHGDTPPSRSRPCLNHQMGQCLAPCVGLADHGSYMEMVGSVRMILDGHSRDLAADLERRMGEAAENLRFEEAAMLRDASLALSRTLEKQVVLGEARHDQDVFGLARQGTAAALVVLSVRDGAISGSRDFFLHDPYGDDAAIISQGIGQLYDEDSNFPKEILLPLESEDEAILAERLSDMAGFAVQFLHPRAGRNKVLLQMAATNAQQIFADREKRRESWQGLAAALSGKLRLARSPETIECLDISNTSGQMAVGSLVCFRGGQPEPGRFRHYRIKTVDGPDDYKMMGEVLRRRLQRGLEEDNLPDLFMVDGGRGQLGVAMEVAAELGISERLEWLGIAKERAEEGEKLYQPGRKNPIMLAKHDPALLYLMRIRDEAHRFGVTFHRRLRGKNSLTSQLAAIPGIGADRQKALLKHFGSVRALKAATLAGLQKAPGIGGKLAAAIFSHLHGGKNHG